MAMSAFAQEWGLTAHVDIRHGDVLELMRPFAAASTTSKKQYVLCVSDLYDGDCGILRPGALLDASIIKSMCCSVVQTVPSSIRVLAQPWDCSGALRRRALVVPDQTCGIDVSCANSLATGAIADVDVRWLRRVGTPLAPPTPTRWLTVGAPPAAALGNAPLLGKVALPLLATEAGEVEAIAFSFEFADADITAAASAPQRLDAMTTQTICESSPVTKKSATQVTNVSAALLRGHGCWIADGSSSPALGSDAVPVQPFDTLEVHLELDALLTLGRPLLSGVCLLQD